MCSSVKTNTSTASCSESDATRNAQEGTFSSVSLVATGPSWEIRKTMFPQVDRFIPCTEIFYSPHSVKRRLLRAFPGVVATCPKTRGGYQAFPQVSAFIPPTRAIYSPMLATTLVATCWLPTGYHPRSTISRTWRHGLSPVGRHGTRRTGFRGLQQ